MSPPIGTAVKRETGRDTMNRARARAALVPDLLIEAHHVANSVYSGWHGRKKRGVGENFWQFRPYVVGESLARIDWRRSARDHHIYVQDKEWQAAHTVWFWIDESPSMLFKSEFSEVSKQSRALVVMFALAELLARSGERVGLLGLTGPILSRNAPSILAEAMLTGETGSQIPKHVDLGSHSELILLSDFLNPLEQTAEDLKRLAGRGGTRGHLIHILDPAEELFPYQGRVEFSDPESGESIIVGNAESMKRSYQDELAARSVYFRQMTNRLGWSYTTHHTDRPASQVLVTMHGQLGVPANQGHLS